jgi:hypothetical protein
MDGGALAAAAVMKMDALLRLGEKTRAGAVRRLPPQGQSGQIAAEKAGNSGRKAYTVAYTYTV